MRRRQFIALVGGALASPMGVRAQQQIRRIGYLSLSTATAAPQPLEAFQQGLRELGWVEGQNIIVEYRFAEGEPERLPGLANELVGIKVELIAAATTPPALAAKNATETIPIVGISFDNPVQSGSSRASRGRAGMSQGCLTARVRRFSAKTSSCSGNSSPSYDVSPYFRTR
jgi:ABC-type uncharacterized transport system substrate-binding protein